MPEIMTPNGPVDFPDSMSQEEIEAVLAKEFPAPATVSTAPTQYTGPMRIPAQAVSMAAKGAFETAGLPGDIEGLALRAVGSKEPTILPTSNELVNFGRKFGVFDNPSLRLTGDTERYIGSGAEGLGSALPFLPFSPAATPLLASGVGAGVGSQFARDVSGGNPLITLGGGVVGGMTGSGLTNLAERGYNLLTGSMTPEFSDFSTAGVPIRSPAYTSDNPSVKYTLGSLAPKGKTENDLGQVIESTANSFGPERTLQQAGEVLQNSARNWIQNVLPQKEAAAWAPVDAAVPGNSAVNLTGFEATLQHMTSGGGAIQAVVDKLRPGLAKQLLDALQNKSLVPLGIGATWNDVRTLRTAIGDALRNPSLSASIGQENLRRLYAAVTGDLRATTQNIDAAASLNGGNPVATKLFDQANAESTRLHAFEENVLGKVIHGKNEGQESIKPEEAAKRLLQGGKIGASDLADLRAEMPDAANALSAAHLRDIGLSDATDATSPVNPKFSKSLENTSPEAVNSLWGQAAPRVRAAGRIQTRLVPESKPPGSLAHASGAVTGSFIGGPATELLATQLLQASHNSLIPEAVGQFAGATLGWAAPTIGRLSRSLAANNVPLAYYYGAKGAPPFVLGRLAASANAARGNALNPSPEQ